MAKAKTGPVEQQQSIFPQILDTVQKSLQSTSYSPEAKITPIIGSSDCQN